MLAQVFMFSVATMNLLELRAKILNFDICRLCLGESCEELTQLDDELPENRQKPRALIEKFHLIQVVELLMSTIAELPILLPARLRNST